MKTSITHKNKEFSYKGILASAYIHHSDAYILFKEGMTCVLHLEDEDEKRRVQEFINQLQMGAYVFVYCTRVGYILKIFDMLSGAVLDCFQPDDSNQSKEEFSGILRLKAKEVLRLNREIYIFAVTNADEIRYYAYLVDCAIEEETKKKLMKLQAGDEISVLETKFGQLSCLVDYSQNIKFGVE